jgi:ribonuclease Z
MGMMGRKAPVNLYGPEILKEMMEKHMAYFGPFPFELNFTFPVAGKDAVVYDDEKVSVIPVPLKHRTQTYGFIFREKKKLLNLNKAQVEAYGPGIADLVKIKHGEDFTTESGEVVPNRKLTLAPYRRRSYAYISDTVFDTDLVDHIRGVDLLFHEATFAGRDEKLARETLHSTAIQAATIAKQAGVKRLLIGHFSSRYRDHDHLVEEAREVFNPTDGVNDGDVYSIPLERESTE